VWVDAQEVLRKKLTSKSLAELASGFHTDRSREVIRSLS